MDRKECANGLELIKIASLKLKGHFSAAFMGCLAMTTPLILCMFMASLFAIFFGQLWIFTVGLILFMILLGPLQVGLVRYFNHLMDGKQPRLREVYSQLNFSFFTMRTIYISTLLVLMYIIGGIAYILPAGFAISFFSMIPFFLEKFKYDRLSIAMKDTASKMIGNRLAMFSYKLIFYLVYFMLFVVCALIILLVCELAIDNLLIAYVVALCGLIVFIFLYTMVTVYYHSSNQIFFEDVLTRDEKKRAKKIVVTEQTLTMHDAENSQEKQIADGEIVAKSNNEVKDGVQSEESVKPTSRASKSRPSTKKGTQSKTSTSKKSTTKSTAKKSTKSTAKTTKPKAVKAE